MYVAPGYYFHLISTDALGWGGRKDFIVTRSGWDSWFSSSPLLWHHSGRDIRTPVYRLAQLLSLGCLSLLVCGDPATWCSIRAFVFCLLTCCLSGLFIGERVSLRFLFFLSSLAGVSRSPTALALNLRSRSWKDILGNSSRCCSLDPKVPGLSAVFCLLFCLSVFVLCITSKPFIFTLHRYLLRLCRNISLNIITAQNTIDSLKHFSRA